MKPSTEIRAQLVFFLDAFAVRAYLEGKSNLAREIAKFNETVSRGSYCRYFSKESVE